MGNCDLFGEWSLRTVVLIFAGLILKTPLNQYALCSIAKLDILEDNMACKYTDLLFAGIWFVRLNFGGPLRDLQTLTP